MAMAQYCLLNCAPSWTAGSYVTHETKHFIYFYLGERCQHIKLSCAGDKSACCYMPLSLAICRPGGSALVQVRMRKAQLVLVTGPGSAGPQASHIHSRMACRCDV